MTMKNLIYNHKWMLKALHIGSANDENLHPPYPLTLTKREINRLKALPRLMHTSTQVGDRNFHITDPFWFLHCYEELCVGEIYRFQSKNASPLILDCGANVGLSVIYFKHLYPGARILAFEPDPTVFKALVKNVASFELQDVTLYQKAVWDRETTVMFDSDGSVGGRISDERFTNNSIEVSTVRLRDWLETPIDMLKIDIEGAEYEVLMDCRDRLMDIDYLFIEYHGKPYEPQRLHEVLSVLDLADFRYHIKDAYPIAHPFIEEERSKYYDLQLNIFAFRV